MKVKQSNKFVYVCLREEVGTNASFWAKDGKGYTTDLAKAETYTKEEVQSKWDSGRIIDMPAALDALQNVSHFKVDMQYVPNESFYDPKSSVHYYAYISGKFSGNDLYFLTKDPADGIESSPYVDLNLQLFSLKRVKQLRIIFGDMFVFLPVYIISNKKRLTVEKSSIIQKKVCTAYGIFKPKHLQRETRNTKRRVFSTKEKMNCRRCGHFYYVDWKDTNADFSNNLCPTCNFNYGYLYG